MWSKVKSQPKIAEILRKTIVNERISHAYLFSGSKGSGLSEVALQFAKALLCPNGIGGDSCDQCHVCKRIDHGVFPDLMTVLPEGGSIKLDQIRLLQEEFGRKSVYGKYKGYIIHEAERMTREAQNRLLKFLEEPDGSTVAILLTSEPGRILPTIRSRCQVFLFKERSWKEISHQLESEGYPIGDAQVAAFIGGNFEEALRLCQKESFAELRQKVIKFYYKDWGQMGRAFTAFHESFLIGEGMKEDLPLLIDLSLLFHRDLMQAALGNEGEVANRDALPLLIEMAQRQGAAKINRKIMTILEGKRNYEATRSTLAIEKMILEIEGE